MPNWHILPPKLQTAQTANSFFMSLINSWENINHHLFLPQFLSLSSWEFFSYCHDKVAIRNQLDCGTSQVLASPYNHDIEFQQTPFISFQPITTDYLHSIITKCAPKSCELDPIPISLLECLETVLPTMTSITNDFKNPTLDPNDLKNYQPVSNLPFMFKILKKVIVFQLMSHWIDTIFSVVCSLHIDLGTVLKLPFLKLSMTFFWQWMRVNCWFWYSLTYLQRLIPLTTIYYSTVCSMCSVFMGLCYLVQILSH